MRPTFLAGSRACLIGFLAASLLNLPVMAAGAPSLGMIVTSQDAQLSNATAKRGADVYTGDTLVTQPNGSLRLAIGSNQLYLLGSTQATMLRNSGAVRAKVAYGTVDFSAASGTFDVETPLGVIRGDGYGHSFGQVAVLSHQKIQISAYEGSLLMTAADGEAKTIAAGETYVASLEPFSGQAGPGIQGVGRPGKINWRRVAQVGVIVGGTAIASLFIYKEVTESCSQVNCEK